MPVDPDAFSWAQLQGKHSCCHTPSMCGVSPRNDTQCHPQTLGYTVAQSWAPRKFLELVASHFTSKVGKGEKKKSKSRQFLC